MNEEELAALFGPASPFSDHKKGETITFRAQDQEGTGEILWVSAPQQVVIGGKVHPVTYWVDTGAGMPVPVYPGEVIG